MIIPLSDTVRSQIKSSVEVTSLSDAVEQLLRNALDADASNVRVEVDFKKGFCAVTDNGGGIPAQEFGEDGNLARPYCTSKNGRQAYYGTNGQSLACISALALVSITSRTSDGAAHSLLLHQPKRISSGLAADETADEIKPSGTKVVVHNLFGNLVVRYKAQAARSSTPAELERQFLHLKKRLVGYMLSFPKAVDLRLSVRDTKLIYHHKAMPNRSRYLSFSANVVQSVLRQASLVSATEAESWKMASAKASGVSIRAAISTIPCPSKECQFISWACQPVQRVGLGAPLYNKVNDLFEASTFGTVDETKDRNRTRIGTGLASESIRASLGDGRAKGVDRWPCFYIRIDTQSKELISTLSSRNECEHDAGNSLQRVVSLLTTLVEQVLQSQQLRPRRIERSSRNNLPKPRQGAPVSASKAGFDVWSRAKAAFPGSVEDICDSLPFVTDCEVQSLEPPIDPDVQLLLNDMRLDNDPSTSMPISTPIDEAPQTESEPQRVEILLAADDCVTWNNPRTGKTVRLNNNGFAVPLTAAAGEPRPVVRREMGQRLPRKGPTLQDIVGTLHQWPSQTFACRPEVALPSVAIDFEATAPASDYLASVIEQRVSASDLACAQVLGQVDQKFILALAPTNDSGDNLMLIDQHAADERVKVEELYRELCSAAAVALARPLIVESSGEEARRFDELQSSFASWGIRYETAVDTLRVTHLPRMVAERCRQDPRILVDLLRREIWSDGKRGVRGSWSTDQSWVDRMAHCPAGLADMVNSRACRSAIMFNDVLTVDECGGLVRELARCTLPFQCAHGRPSLVVVTNLGYLDLEGRQHTDRTISFGDAFKRWI